MTSAISRRRACALVGGGAMLMLSGFSLLGCSGSSEESDPHARSGFADDTLIKDYALTVKIIADSNLARCHADSNGISRLEEFFSKYQAQSNRGDVTISVKYIDSVSMALDLASSGLLETCDGVIGLSGTIDYGVGTGVLYGGQANTSVRKLNVLSEKIVVVRAVGSSVEMPASSTLNGEDSPDGQFTKIDNLASFDGKIAVAATSLIEGVLANKLLYQHGFYTDSSGLNGDYDSSIKSKMTVYDTIDDLASAVESGECDLGFMAQSSLWSEHTEVEATYEPGLGGNDFYEGASTVDAAEGGVVRDFFEYLSRQV